MNFPHISQSFKLPRSPFSPLHSHNVSALCLPPDFRLPPLAFCLPRLAVEGVRMYENGNSSDLLLSPNTPKNILWFS